MNDEFRIWNNKNKLGPIVCPKYKGVNVEQFLVASL